MALSFIITGIAKTIKVQSEYRQSQEAQQAAWDLSEELIGYAILNNRFPTDISEVTSNPYGFDYQVDPNATIRIYKDILDLHVDVNVSTLCIQPYSEDCNDPNANNIYALFLLTHPKYPEIQEWVGIYRLSYFAARGWNY